MPRLARRLLYFPGRSPSRLPAKRNVRQGWALADPGGMDMRRRVGRARKCALGGGKRTQWQRCVKRSESRCLVAGNRFFPALVRRVGEHPRAVAADGVLDVVAADGFAHIFNLAPSGSQRTAGEGATGLNRRALRATVVKHDHIDLVAASRGLKNDGLIDLTAFDQGDSSGEIISVLSAESRDALIERVDDLISRGTWGLDIDRSAAAFAHQQVRRTRSPGRCLHLTKGLGHDSKSHCTTSRRASP